MGRLTRKKWNLEKFGDDNSPGIFGLFDSNIKAILRITDDEYDLIAETASDEDIDVIVNMNPTFFQKRQLIEILNKYVNY